MGSRCLDRRRGPLRQVACVLSLALVVDLSAGCRGEDATGEPSDDARPRMRTILTADRTLPDKRPEDLSLAIDGALRHSLLSEKNFQAALGSDLAACTAEFDVVYALIVNGEAVQEASQGVARAALEGRVHCLPPGQEGDHPESFHVDLLEEQVFGRDGLSDGPAVLRDLALGLARRAADIAYGQVVMRHAPDGRILEVLRTGQHEGLLIEAASEAGERKLHDAIESLVARTADPREHVRLRAGAALGLLGDRRPEVIRALAAMTRGSAPEPLLMAVHALGDIGGKDAARYLESIADSHPIKAVREAARASLDRARAPRRSP